MCYQVLGRTAVKRVCGLTLVFALLAVHRASQVVNLGGRFKLRKISSSPSNAVDASPLAFVLWRALDSGYNPYGNIQGTRCGSPNDRPKSIGHGQLERRHRMHSAAALGPGTS